MLDEGVYSIGERDRRRREHRQELREQDPPTGADWQPDIIEAILAGRTDQALMLERLERPLPADWQEEQEQLQ